MRGFFYALALLGSVAGGLYVLLVTASARSAPQEAAGYAGACAFAVVPYVFARAYDLLSNRDTKEQLELMKRAVKALEKQGDRET